MEKSPYIEREAEGYRVVGTRVSLDSIIHAFLDGQAPESIADAFPTISLEKVYGAITFYLANRSEIDAYLEQGRAAFEHRAAEARKADPSFYRKLEEARLRQTSR